MSLSVLKAYPLSLNKKKINMFYYSIGIIGVGAIFTFYNFRAWALLNKLQRNASFTKIVFV